jgi:hypothetical protein
MTTPFTGFFIDASCNSRFSHVKETDSRYRIMFVDSENNTLSFQSNNGDLVPLKPLGINHVHRPTHAPQAPASVDQGVSIATRPGSLYLNTNNPPKDEFFFFSLRLREVSSMCSLL